MASVEHNTKPAEVPYVVWTLVMLNVVIYLWDRQWHFFGPSIVFGDLSMRPREVVQAVLQVGNPLAFITVFTSMFMHAGMQHLVANMIFIIVFGIPIERALGAQRFALYYLLWGVAAAATQIYFEPSSSTQVLGASGAIGGVLGAYFLLFPGVRIEFAVPGMRGWRPAISAWVLLGAWLLWQILTPLEGVANWAHAGGFLAGMLTVLVLGGREAILYGHDPIA